MRGPAGHLADARRTTSIRLGPDLTSVGASVLSLLLSLVLMGVFLAALHVVIAAAVEQGIRRSPTDASLRPSFWELRRQQQRSEGDWQALMPRTRQRADGTGPRT